MAPEATRCTLPPGRTRCADAGIVTQDLALLSALMEQHPQPKGGRSEAGRDRGTFNDVLLVAPWELRSEALISALAQQGQKLSHRSDALSALLAIGSRSWPAAILVACQLDDASGLELCSSLRSFGYRGPLLILRQSEGSAPTVAALDAGADDVIDAHADAAEIAARLRAQSRRLALVATAPEPEPWRLQPPQSLAHPRSEAGGREAQNPLTPREQEVLEQMVLGLGNNEIAERLFLSLDTVKTHVRNLMGKLKARHRTQAVIVALQSGYCLLPAGGGAPSGRPNTVGC